MTLDDKLDGLAHGSSWVADWPDVIERADLKRSTHLVTKRRVVLALAVVVAVLVPLAALGAANDWWFLRFAGGPLPAAAPTVVQEGVWDGHPWLMTAYPSTTDGLCMAITPKDSATSSGQGGAQECGPFAGVGRTSQTKATPDLTITYLSGSGSKELPAYIAGPVIGSATTVEVRFGNGTTLRAQTFAGPKSLGSVRFYASQLPAGFQDQPRTKTFFRFVRWVAGFDANGQIVACLAPQAAKDGVSALSGCR
jgi:hypothetical protein